MPAMQMANGTASRERSRFAEEQRRERDDVERGGVLQEDGVSGSGLLSRADVEAEEQREEGDRDSGVARAGKRAGAHERGEQGGREQAPEHRDAGGAGVDLLDEEAARCSRGAAPERRKRRAVA